MAFVEEKYYGWDVTIGDQIDKGNICMKEGGKGEEDWLVLGWQDCVSRRSNDEPCRLEVSMKFE